MSNKKSVELWYLSREIIDYENEIWYQDMLLLVSGRHCQIIYSRFIGNKINLLKYLYTYIVWETSGKIGHDESFILIYVRYLEAQPTNSWWLCLAWNYLPQKLLQFSTLYFFLYWPPIRFMHAHFYQYLHKMHEIKINHFPRKNALAYMEAKRLVI